MTAAAFVVNTFLLPSNAEAPRTMSALAQNLLPGLPGHLATPLPKAPSKALQQSFRLCRQDESAIALVTQHACHAAAVEKTLRNIGNAVFKMRGKPGRISRKLAMIAGATEMKRSPSRKSAVADAPKVSRPTWHKHVRLLVLAGCLVVDDKDLVLRRWSVANAGMAQFAASVAWRRACDARRQQRFRGKGTFSVSEVRAFQDIWGMSLAEIQEMETETLNPPDKKIVDDAEDIGEECQNLEAYGLGNMENLSGCGSFSDWGNLSDTASRWDGAENGKPLSILAPETPMISTPCEIVTRVLYKNSPTPTPSPALDLDAGQSDASRDMQLAPQPAPMIAAPSPACTPDDLVAIYQVPHASAGALESPRPSASPVEHQTAVLAGDESLFSWSANVDRRESLSSSCAELVSLLPPVVLAADDRFEQIDVAPTQGHGEDGEKKTLTSVDVAEKTGGKDRGQDGASDDNDDIAQCFLRLGQRVMSKTKDEACPPKTAINVVDTVDTMTSHKAPKSLDPENIFARILQEAAGIALLAPSTSVAAEKGMLATPPAGTAAVHRIPHGPRPSVHRISGVSPREVAAMAPDSWNFDYRYIGPYPLSESMVYQAIEATKANRRIRRDLKGRYLTRVLRNLAFDIPKESNT